MDLNDLEGKKRDIDFDNNVNKYVINKMKKFNDSKHVKPIVNTGLVSPSKLEGQLHIKMGKLNRTNPDKITSNTLVQNPTQMTAHFLYKKRFQDLSYD